MFNQFTCLIAVAVSILGNGFIIISFVANKKSLNTFTSLVINILFIDLIYAIFTFTGIILKDTIPDKKFFGLFEELFQASSRTMVLISLIILSFYVIFSSVQNVLIETIVSKENIFIIIFMMWSIIIGMNCVYQKKIIDFLTCIPKNYMFAFNRHLDLILFEILIFQQCIILYLQEKRKNAKMSFVQTEIFYIHNTSVSIQNIPTHFNDMNKSLRYLTYTLTMSFIIFWLSFLITQFLFLVDESIVTHDTLVQLHFFGSMKGVVTPIAILIIYAKNHLIYN
ncbi:hypothetical protein ACKWTF_009970 [Chironomus riparius]